MRKYTILSMIVFVSLYLIFGLYWLTDYVCSYKNVPNCTIIEIECGGFSEYFENGTGRGCNDSIFSRLTL